MKMTITKDDLELTQKPSLSGDFWKNKKLNQKVRTAILKIVDNFLKSTNLDIKSKDVGKIQFTGSLANYNFSKLSDVDVHLLLNFKKLGSDPKFMEDYLSTKAILWNNTHKITIFGHEVELYIADIHSDHYSTGIYDVKKNKWDIEPVIDPKLTAELNIGKVKDKADKISKQINAIAAKKDIAFKDLEDLKDKIKKMRLAGLEKEGEYSLENLTFKLLRRRGELDTLYNLMVQTQDKELSLDEDMEWWKKRRFSDNKRYKELMGYTKGAKISRKGKPYMIIPSFNLPKSGPPGVGTLEEGGFVSGKAAKASGILYDNLQKLAKAVSLVANERGGKIDAIDDTLSNIYVYVYESAATHGHVKGSAHYTGNAADFEIVQKMKGGKVNKFGWIHSYLITLAAMAADIIAPGGLGLYFDIAGKKVNSPPHYDVRGTSSAWKWVGSCGSKADRGNNTKCAGYKSSGASKADIINSNHLDLPPDWIKYAKAWVAEFNKIKSELDNP